MLQWRCKWRWTSLNTWGQERVVRVDEVEASVQGDLRQENTNTFFWTLADLHRRHKLLCTHSTTASWVLVKFKKVWRKLEVVYHQSKNCASAMQPYFLKFCYHLQSVCRQIGMPHANCGKPWQFYNNHTAVFSNLL